MLTAEYKVSHRELRRELLLLRRKEVDGLEQYSGTESSELSDSTGKGDKIEIQGASLVLEKMDGWAGEEDLEAMSSVNIYLERVPL